MEQNLSEFLPKLKLINGLNAKVYLKNWPAGFGSALVCLMDNIEFFNKYNTTLIPLWNNNTTDFKFSDGINDCFREYFDDTALNIEEEDIKNSIILKSDIPTIQGAGLTNTENDLSYLSKLFKQRFKIKDKYYNLFNSLTTVKEFDFSIHLRSNYQKRFHYNNNLINVEEVIIKLYKKYGKDAIPFIATDVNPYLVIFLKYFPKAVYNAGCFRSNDDFRDTVVQITNPGIRHGEDIILDLIGLSKGKKIYMSESNLYIVTRLICDDNKSIDNLRTL